MEKLNTIEIRKANKLDIPAISKIYDDIHSFEERGEVIIGWKRGIYPTTSVAEDSLNRDDLFVETDNGVVVGTAIINKIQVDVYAKAKWKYTAPNEEVMVLHTLVISPYATRKGYGQRFVEFYENYALLNGCDILRMDTNVKNIGARKMYNKLGYIESDIAPCVFNGIEGVELILLEKKLK